MLGFNDFPLSDPYATARQLIALPPHHRKTFVADMPTQTHFRKVDCKEAAARGECKHYANGWATPLSPTDIEGFKAWATEKGYTFAEGEVPPHLEASYEPGTRFLIFPPEQRCLISWRVPHRIPLDHDPLLSVRGGDFRYFTGNDNHGMRQDSWVNQLQNTVGELRDEVEKG
jgi:hypothetical protein